MCCFSFSLIEWNACSPQAIILTGKKQAACPAGDDDRIPRASGAHLRAWKNGSD